MICRFSLFLFITFLVVPAPAQSAAQIAGNADQYMQALVARRHFSGYVVIARDSKPLFAGAYGMANYEDDAPVTAHTRFRVGSITKQFTAMAIMILQEKSKLSLSDSVCNYMETCPASWQPITIQHLLTHTSGLPNYTTFPDIARLKAMGTTPAVLVEEIKQHPLEFTPGEKYAYSNSGYVVLGSIIERVSGQPYADFIQQQIFAPLGMTDSGYETTAIVPHRAMGYVWKNHARWNADYIDMSVTYSAGALYSTADDMLRWDAALYGNKLVSAKGLQEMFTPFRDNAAYGWFLQPDKQARRWLVHDGRVNGFASFIARDPADHLFVLILSNLENTNVDAAYDDLRSIAFGEPYKLPPEYHFVQVSPVVLDAYVGVYQLPWGTQLFITATKGRLYIAGKNQAALEVRALSDTKFYLEDQDLVIEFMREAGKPVATLLFGTFSAKRVSGPPSQNRIP
jgi:CubicO group peptidase (beta-lactamase class C family)